MTTQDIANQLVALLREGNYEAIYDQLFDAEKVRHIEPQSPHFADLTGVEALKAKDTAMMAHIEQAALPQVGEPIIAGNHFAVPYLMSATLKNGQSLSIDEIILYQVEGGKIVLEQFFYSPQVPA